MVNIFQFKITNAKLHDEILGKRYWEIATFFLIIISFVPEKKYDTKYQRVWHPANDSLPWTEFCRYENLFDSYFWKLSIFLTCTYVEVVMKSKKKYFIKLLLWDFFSYICKYLFLQSNYKFRTKKLQKRFLRLLQYPEDHSYISPFACFDLIEEILF